MKRNRLPFGPGKFWTLGQTRPGTEPTLLSPWQMSAAHFFPRDEYFMRLALREADARLEHDDVPIGAVVVRDGEVIGAGHNERELRADPTAHAEMLALREAARALGSWRVLDARALRDARAVRDVRRRDRARARPARRVRRHRPQGRRRRQRARRARRAPAQPPPAGRRAACSPRSPPTCFGPFLLPGGGSRCINLRHGPGEGSANEGGAACPIRWGSDMSRHIATSIATRFTPTHAAT